MSLDYHCDQFGPSTPARAIPVPSWRQITEEVAARHQVKWDEITGSNRERRVSWARHEAMALIYAEGKLSTTQIGDRFGRDHTTVIYATRAYKARLSGLDYKKPGR